MPSMVVCDRHKRLVPTGETCPECPTGGREHARRHRNNVQLGRNSTHWRRLSKRARRLAGGVCPDCGGLERSDDPGSKLTADLVGGGNHARARLEDVRVRCRRCHGAADGGRVRAA